MSKFIIKEVFIDKFNATYNELKNFEGGLNVICGDNEIGKSTMMSFIKSLFGDKPIDGSGYISCLDDEKEIKFKINEAANKQFMIDRKITSHEYFTGFIITLDDLMLATDKDEKDLINIIKDSSGKLVNDKQIEYENYVNNFISDNTYKTHRPLKPFTQLFKNLNNISDEIKKLEQYEEEYNNCCRNLENLEKQFTQKERECECAELSNQIFNIKKEITKIDINNQLLDLKQEYENIRHEHSILKLKKSEEEKINIKIDNLNNDYETALKNLNKFADYSTDEIKNFDTTAEKLNQAQILISEKNNIKSELEKIYLLISNIKDNIKNKQKDIDKINQRIAELKIEDIDKYKNDRILLGNYIELYKEEYEKMRQAVSVEKNEINNYTVFLLTFGGLLLIGLAMFLLTKGFPRIMSLPVIFASLGGMLNAIVSKKRKILIQNNISIKKFDYLKNNINNLLKKYGIESNKNDIEIKADSLIQEMNFKIAEYKPVSNDLIDKNVDLDDLNNQLSEKEKEKNIIEKSQEENISKTKDFLDNLLINDIEKYTGVHEQIKELKRILTEIEKYTEERNEIKYLTEQFANKLNEFIEKTNIFISKTNEFEYEKYENIVSEITKLFEDNLKKSQSIEYFHQKIEKLNNALDKKYSDIKNKYTDYSDEKLIDIKASIEDIKESRTKAREEKIKLEEVEGLSELKLKRNTEINKVRKQVNNIIVKEIILSIIETAKKEFNKQKPSLINANKYLSEITNKKYNEIDIENNVISGNQEPEKEWNKLSRGTKEQLYLSLRLGYASNFSKNNDGSENGIPNLPVLIDDAFVNFDKNRTVAILKCLEKLSETNQIIYFTCHTKYTEDLLKSNKIKHNLIKL